MDRPGPECPVGELGGRGVDMGVVRCRCLAGWTVVVVVGSEWTVDTPPHPASGVTSRIVRPYPAATIARISLVCLCIMKPSTYLLFAARAVKLVRLEVLVRHLEELLDSSVLRTPVGLEDELEDGDVDGGEHDLELGDLWVGVRGGSGRYRSGRWSGSWRWGGCMVCCGGRGGTGHGVNDDDDAMYWAEDEERRKYMGC